MSAQIGPGAGERGHLCEHGVTEPPSVGVAMNAPWSYCGCCRFPFFYLDSGTYTNARTASRTWTPKDRCGACGGVYVEFTAVHNGRSS